MYDEERPYETYNGTPDGRARKSYWDMGAGLQAVDGLETSNYASNQAARYIAGDMSAMEFRHEVEHHYEGSKNLDTRQADIVATRIVSLLDSSPATRFELTGRQLCIIHGSLFANVLPKPWVGTYRTEDIAKHEPILGGSSVMYSPAAEVAMSIDYDMGLERSHPSYDVHDEKGLTHFVSFVAGIWQIHPFREGNTRTTAVFSQLYLRRLGIEADNEPFLHNSLYYRDALVRASVTAPTENAPDMTFLTAFYDSVVNGHKLETQVDMNVHDVRDDDTPYRDTSEYGESKGL